MGARLSPKVPPPCCLWRENIPLPAPGDNSVHSLQRQQQPFGFLPLCRRKQGQEEERRHHLEGSCCSYNEERLHEFPPRWSTPCSLDDCWSRENQASLVFLLLPSSLLHPPERVCSCRERARAGSPLGILSCLTPPWLSLQLGPGASDLHPSSPKTSSSTKPSPRQQRKRNPPNAVLHLVCALLPVPSRRRAAGFRSRCRSSPPTSVSVMHLFGCISAI